MSVVHESPSEHPGPGAHAPAPSQWSPAVHALPSLHATDVGCADQVVWLVADRHRWHGFDGFAVPVV